MSITFNCPHCEREIKVQDRNAGKRSRCPTCSGILVVPGLASETLPEAVAASEQPPANVELEVPAEAVTETPAPAPFVPEPGERWRTKLTTTPPVLAAQKNSADGSSGHDDHDDDHDDDDDEEHHMSALIPHKGGPHEELIDMTPMVDIVFFLLIFFLTTSLQALQAVMDLPTPQTATDRAASRSVSDLANDSDTLIVKIQEDDTFWIDDEQVPSDQDLRVRIKAAKDEGGDKPLSLVVVGNADASHGAAIRVFDAGAAAGVGSISLLVQEETE